MKLYFSCGWCASDAPVPRGDRPDTAPCYALKPSLSRIAVSVEAASKSGRLLI